MFQVDESSMVINVDYFSEFLTDRQTYGSPEGNI